jgi:hypothetical protein
MSVPQRAWPPTKRQVSPDEQVRLFRLAPEPQQTWSMPPQGWQVWPYNTMKFTPGLGWSAVSVVGDFDTAHLISCAATPPGVNPCVILTRRYTCQSVGDICAGENAIDFFETYDGLSFSHLNSPANHTTFTRPVAVRADWWGVDYAHVGTDSNFRLNFNPQGF